MGDVLEELTRFVEGFVGLRVGPDQELAAAGVDSMQLVSVLTFLELRFGVSRAAFASDDTRTLRALAVASRRHAGR